MPIRTVDLTDHFDTFIDSVISSGHFSNAGEVVREGLRLLEQCEAEDQAKLQWLQSTAQDNFAAIDHGKGMEFHSIEDLTTFIDQTGEGLADQLRASLP